MEELIELRKTILKVLAVVDKMIDNHYLEEINSIIKDELNIKTISIFEANWIIDDFLYNNNIKNSDKISYCIKNKELFKLHIKNYPKIFSKRRSFESNNELQL